MLELFVGDPKDKTVKRFAKHLSGKPKAFSVPRQAFQDAQFGRCYVNASAYALASGGSVVSGWAIRVSPKLFLEAEQHAIVEDRQGRFLDVTPHPRNETKTCFVPDRKLQFSAAGGATIENQYYAFCDGKLADLVRRLLEIVRKQQSMMMSTGNLHYGFNMQERIPELHELIAEIEDEMAKDD